TPAHISLRSMRADPPPPGEGKKETQGSRALLVGCSQLRLLLMQSSARKILQPVARISEAKSGTNMTAFPDVAPLIRATKMPALLSAKESPAGNSARCWRT